MFAREPLLARGAHFRTLAGEFLRTALLLCPAQLIKRDPVAQKFQSSKTKTTPLPSNFKKCWHVFAAAMLCPLTATKFYDERVRRSDSTSSRLQGLRAAEHLASHGPCLRWIMPGDVGASMEFSTCKITQKESICPPTNVWHQLPTYVCVCVCGRNMSYLDPRKIRRNVPPVIANPC